MRTRIKVEKPTMNSKEPTAKVKMEPAVKLEETCVKTEEVFIKSEGTSIKGEPLTTATSKKRARPGPAAAAEGPSARRKLPHSRPTEQECRAVHRALSMLHPEVIKRSAEAAGGGSCGRRHCVLDSLVGTILSQNTTDINSHRAFSRLKAALPTWEEVRLAPPVVIEDAIRPGGLAAIKTARIQAILEELHSTRGKCCLEYMRALPDEQVKAELRSYKGVGAKTVSCVLMFGLGRQDFPVDTHVWKIALALGWVPKTADRDVTYEHLNTIVPPEIKHELHVLLVQHGKDHKNGVALLRQTLSTFEE